MIRAAEIEAAIVRNFNVPRELFYSKCRNRPVAHPRQLAMFLTREMIGMTLEQIARRHNRDHTTVIHGIKAAQKRLANDPALALKVDAIRRVIRDNARKPANSSEVWGRIIRQIEDPISRKIVIMSKYERGELTQDETRNLIHALDLEAA
jgi:hypothetical protein